MPIDQDIPEDAREFQLREQVREAASAVPPAVREELFGQAEVAPSVVVDTAEHAAAFRGVEDGTVKKRLAKQALDDAARAITEDPAAALAHYNSLLERYRGPATESNNGVH
jgi:hypothetical protein